MEKTVVLESSDYCLITLYHFRKSGGILSDINKVLIDARPPQKLLMGALLRNLAVVDDQNLIGVPDGIQPVGNDKQSLSFDQFKNRFLDVTLVIGIYAGSLLVDFLLCGVRLASYEMYE